MDSLQPPPRAGRIGKRGTPSPTVVVALGVALLAIGCGEELGPEPMPTAAVAGRVTLAGRPLDGGWLEFLPVDGTVGRLATTRIGPDGSFRCDRVAVGTVAVRVAGADLPPPEYRVFGNLVYPIRLDVPAAGVDGLTLDLVAERRRIEAEAPARPPG